MEHGSVETKGSARVVRASGEVDVVTAPLLRDRLNGAVNEGSGDVVVDLAEVTFMDSTGVAVLIGARNGLRGTDRKLLLRNPTAPVRRVLEMLALAEVLPIESEGDNPSS